jgi:hypothetical protein
MSSAVISEMWLMFTESKHEQMINIDQKLTSCRQCEMSIVINS